MDKPPKLIGMTSDDAWIAEGFKTQAEGSGHFAIAYGLMKLAEAVHCLGNADAATQLGGLEGLGKELQDGMNQVSNAISDIAIQLGRDKDEC